MTSENISKSREARAPPIPSEWKVELPEEGNRTGSEFGGCRSIEAGYNRQFVLGQGTYGEVYQAIDLENGDVVAAKKIKMDNEKEGFPITAIREIKILSALARSSLNFGDNLLRDHIITLREIVRSGSHKTNNFRGSIYMIFDYMDHDMTGLLARAQREGPRFVPAQIKCYTRQLLYGLALLGANKVLHRDLKNSNLLINNQGILKIGDFGLARYRPQPLEEGQAESARMTNRVITLWYRPPELLLGAQSYGPEIDIWSAGCIMFELLTGKPLFSANDEMGMCEKIFSIVGKANEKTMPGCTAFSNYPHIDFANSKYPNNSRLRHHLQRSGITDAHAMDLMESMLVLDPKQRVTAWKAAGHVWFYTEPLPMKPSQIPKYAASHEMGMKRARHAGAAQRRPPSQQQQQQQPPAKQQRGPGGPLPVAQQAQQRGQGQGWGPGTGGGAAGGARVAPYPPQPYAQHGHYGGGSGPAHYPPPTVFAQQQQQQQQQGGGRPAASLPPPAPMRGPPPGPPPPPAAWQSQRR